MNLKMSEAGNQKAPRYFKKRRYCYGGYNYDDLLYMHCMHVAKKIRAAPPGAKAETPARASAVGGAAVLMMAADKPAGSGPGI